MISSASFDMPPVGFGVDAASSSARPSLITCACRAAWLARRGCPQGRAICLLGSEKADALSRFSFSWAGAHPLLGFPHTGAHAQLELQKADALTGFSFPRAPMQARTCRRAHAGALVQARMPSLAFHARSSPAQFVWQASGS
eukprot:36586-Chlamydomonas_euryale.AAC.1